MKTKFSKLFVTILIVAAVTCCGALGVFAADDANADTTAATTVQQAMNATTSVASAAPAAIAANSENEKTFGKSLIFVALGESIALYGLVISIMILSKLV